MRTYPQAGLTFWAALLLLPGLALGQGSLTPPGAPAPTLKTLAQVEPRIELQSLSGDAAALFLITQPGSYYLSANLSGVSGRSAIAIAADGVTLDLNGFALVGVTGTVRGIDLRSTRANVTIRNGTIRGFEGGGVMIGSGANDCRIEQLSIACAGGGINLSGGGSSNNCVTGCTVSGATSGTGILLGSGRGLVEHCTVRAISGSAGANGISAHLVSNCSVEDISASGSSPAQAIIGFQVENCAVRDVAQTGTNSAIAITATTVTGCMVSGVSSTTGSLVGISGTTVTACTVSGVQGSSPAAVATGISAVTVTGCRVQSVSSDPTAGAAPSGISATVVAESAVSAVGISGAVTGGQPTGIAAPNVRNCTVTNVGQGSQTLGAVGLSGNVVSGCQVSSVAAGGSTLTGIAGIEVSHCSVSSLTLSGGAGLATGINAEVITDCRISSISSASSGDTSGISNFRLTRGCSVANVSNSGAGSAIGAVTTASGRIEAFVAQSGTFDIGISVGSSQTVLGCTIGAATTGILATGTRNVIDGNNVTGSSTTGISVTSGSNAAQALVIRNQVRNCGTNFLLDSACQSGPVVTTAGAIASTNPWANFTD